MTDVALSAACDVVAANRGHAMVSDPEGAAVCLAEGADITGQNVTNARRQYTLDDLREQTLNATATAPVAQAKGQVRNGWLGPWIALHPYFGRQAAGLYHLRRAPCHLVAHRRVIWLAIASPFAGQLPPPKRS